MQKILIQLTLCLFFGINNNHAQEVDFKDIEAEEITRILLVDYDYPGGGYMIELITPNPKYKIRLDCQSFIHELNVYEEKIQWDRLFINIPLDEGPCYSIGHYFINNLSDNKRVCLIYDHKANEAYISQDTQFCF